MILVQLGSNVEDVFVPGEWHRESVTVHDAVKRELVHLVRISHGYDAAHFLDDILKKKHIVIKINKR